jgi:predicted DNA-binding transcriptional regulator YafY
MKRTDRLFEIINILRKAKHPKRAQDIADELEVTPRTVYRYIATLQSMRIPIEGSTGIGYIMRDGYDLPPLNFDQEELEAIIVGLSLLSRTGDTDLQSAAKRVLNKIETSNAEDDSLRVSDWGIDAPQQERLTQLRKAIREETVVEIDYEDLNGDRLRRSILPIILTYYTEVAVVTAWCNYRKGFRNFRIDRIMKATTTQKTFKGRSKELRQEYDATDRSQ